MRNISDPFTKHLYVLKHNQNYPELVINLIIIDTNHFLELMWFLN